MADNAFSGCDALRVVVELEGFSYEEDGAGWGLPEETAAYPYGEETGSGDLRAVSVEEDGAVYALTEDDTAVLLSVPVGAEEYAVPEEVEDCPVSWCSVHAFDAAEEMVSVYLAEQMAFPFELFSEVDWLIKTNTPLESFSMSWFLTCLIASYANDDRLAEDEGSAARGAGARLCAGRHDARGRNSPRSISIPGRTAPRGGRRWRSRA